MKFRIAALLLAAGVVAVVISAFLGGRGDKPPVGDAPPPEKTVAPHAATTPVQPGLPPSPVPPVASDPPPPTAPPQAATPSMVSRGPVAPGSSSPGAPPPTPDLDPVVTTVGDIDKIGLMLRDYRTIMGANPTGTNAEIMKSIMGGNPRQAQLGPPEGQSLNGNGELVDRWGTPYFFHQMSATNMEIRSAGPDKVLWTPDDVMLR